MRSLLIILLFASMSVQNLSAQGIFHYYTGLILPDKDAPMRTDRLGIDLYYNTWQEIPKGVKISPRSIGVNVFRIYDIPFGHSPIGIGIGYGLSSHNVHHDGQFVTGTDSISGIDFTKLVPYANKHNYTKNKISMNYFEIPFELRFRSKKKANKNGVMRGPFRFYPGFKIGYLANIHTARRNDLGRFKEYNFKAIDRIRYGATLRIGYGKFAFYGFYSLSKLFKNDTSSSLQPISIGISFLTF